MWERWSLLSGKYLNISFSTWGRSIFIASVSASQRKMNLNCIWQTVCRNLYQQISSLKSAGNRVTNLRWKREGWQVAWERDGCRKDQVFFPPFSFCSFTILLVFMGGFFCFVLCFITVLIFLLSGQWTDAKSYSNSSSVSLTDVKAQELIVLGFFLMFPTLDCPSLSLV